LFNVPQKRNYNPCIKHSRDQHNVGEVPIQPASRTILSL